MCSQYFSPWHRVKQTTRDNTEHQLFRCCITDFPWSSWSAQPAHALSIVCTWFPTPRHCSSQPALLTPLFMFTRLLPRQRHLCALWISSLGADRRAWVRGGDTQQWQREREREESGETSARAASHSEELTPFTYFLCLDFWFPFFILSLYCRLHLNYYYYYYCVTFERATGIIR